MKERGIKPEWVAFGLADIVQDVQRTLNEGLNEALHLINIVIGDNALQGALTLHAEATADDGRPPAAQDGGAARTAR